MTSRRRVAVGLAWFVAAGATGIVASETSVGPVVLSLSRHHGVHLGDVVAALVAAMCATMVTASLLG